jgi:inosose dehydratase
MSKMTIACSGITWRGEASLETMMAEIAHTGYAGMPASVREDRPIDEYLALYEKHGLQPAPGYYGATFWDPAQEDAILEGARSAARRSQAMGCTELFVSTGPLTRRELAGRVRPEDAIPDEQFAQLANTLDAVGRIALEYGVRACYHNHVGGVIETRAEMDRLFSLVDPDLVFHGPDIGHLAWAGDDVVAYARDYASQIKSVHLKDIDPTVMAQGVAQRWDYRGFSDHGIFAELGEGFVDFPSVMAILKQAGYAGWTVVETDVTQKATAMESAGISREYLRSIGY